MRKSKSRSRLVTDRRHILNTNYQMKSTTSNVTNPFKRAALVVALLFLAVTTYATDVTVTVTVTGNGSVTYGSQTARAGSQISFTAALSTSGSTNKIQFTIMPADGYVATTAKGYYTNIYNLQGYQSIVFSGTTGTMNMPSESFIKSGTGVSVEVTFEATFAGGTEDSPVALNDNAVSILSGGWYAVNADITIDHTLTIYGDTHIVIAGGKTLTVSTSSNNAIQKGDGITPILDISGEGSLSATASFCAISVTTYQQSGGNVTLSAATNGLKCDDVNISGGTLTITNDCTYGMEIPNAITISGGTVNVGAKNVGLKTIRGAVTITGGKVNISLTNDDSVEYSGGILSDGGVTITGGQVTAYNCRIKDRGSVGVTIGYSKSGDFVKALGFGGTVKIADGQTLTDNQGNTYSGTLTSEQAAALLDNQLSTTNWQQQLGALSIKYSDDGVTAVLDGEYTGTDGFTLSESVEVSEVTLNRKFSGGKYSTIVLPFSASIPEGAGEFYTFNGVKYENEKWIADVESVSSIAANTPYIFMANEGVTQLKWNVKTTITPATAEFPVSDQYGTWTFKGTYAPLYWESLAEELPIYGFAGENKNGVAIGEFVRAHSKISVKPFRCYLEYLGSNETFNAAISKSTTAIPDRIEVRVINSVIEPDYPTQNPDDGGDVTTPTSELAPVANLKVWSYDKTIFISAQPGMDYRIIDANGRTLRTATTQSDRDEITLGRCNGIVIVIIGGKTYKVNY